MRAVLGQQVSVRAATRLAARLVADMRHRRCPSPSARSPICSRRRRRSPQLDPDGPADAAQPGADAGGDRGRAGRRDGWSCDEAADRRGDTAALLALPGIGPWTAGYIAMRALRDPDAFTPGDAGVRHGLLRLGWDAEPAELAARVRAVAALPRLRRPASVGARRMSLAFTRMRQPRRRPAAGRRRTAALGGLDRRTALGAGDRARLARVAGRRSPRPAGSWTSTSRAGAPRSSCHWRCAGRVSAPGVG